MVGSLALAGTASAHDDEENGNGQRQRECPRPNCIHPTLGYTGLSPDENLPGPLQPDHEIDLVTEASEDDRPVPEFFFQPTGLHVQTGDVVRFNLATPDHTVTAYHPGLGKQQRVPEGIPPFSSPVLAGGTFWLYRFDEEGVYDVLCAPHEIFGMVGRIVVGEGSETYEMDEEVGEPEAGEDEGHQLLPPLFTAGLVFQDEALTPDHIKEEGQVHWEDLNDDSKRLLVELPEEAEDGE